MTVRNILKMGDPRLLEPSEPVSDVPNQELDQLIEDMLETMEENQGAGLAAPQIGVLKRVVVFGAVSNPRYPDTEEVPRTILINPEIEAIGDEVVESWEGCLSIPGLRGLVPRYASIRYKGIDPQGNQIEREVDGFHAIVVQHECDHLDGILYPMMMPDMSYFGFEDQLSKPPQE
ncbi:MAG: peptide deformylase [Gammaproteobacteria bacterium]|nr:MAG: peptide deformylase [Gammaproteobacteria bacterium]